MLNVVAQRDIDAGEAITTTYIHANNPSALTRRQRNKHLLQYLFECRCELCVQQMQLEGSDDEEEDSEEEEEEEEVE